MRILIGLAVIQTLLLGLIGLRMLEIGAQIETVSQTSLDVLAATSQNAQNQSAPRPMNTGTAAQPVSEMDLNAFRQVMREELSASSHAASAAPAPSTADPAFLLQVNEDVDRFIARGGSDPTSMAALQLKIARLPKEERAKIFSKLTKAMNAGQIENTF